MESKRDNRPWGRAVGGMVLITHLKGAREDERLKNLGDQLFCCMPSCGWIAADWSSWDGSCHDNGMTRELHSSHGCSQRVLVLPRGPCKSPDNPDGFRHCACKLSILTSHIWYRNTNIYHCGTCMVRDC
jgi:hypothetical protein